MLYEAARPSALALRVLTIVSVRPTASHTGPSDQLALELLAAFGRVQGPDLRDARSIHRRRRLAWPGTPTHDAVRATRARSARPARPAVTQSDAGPRDQIGVITVWSANAPPSASGA